MIFKKWKNIIGMYFGTKSYLKSTRNHTAKHALTSLGHRFKKLTQVDIVFFLITSFKVVHFKK
jgi:hypothetical protein